MLGEPNRRETAKDGAKVEAGSPVAFQRIVIDPDLTTSTWIRAIDYKPGDHAWRGPRSSALPGQAVFGRIPWHPTTELPDGVAFQLPAGTRIAVDVLYRGIGETVIDKPTLALYFASNARPVPVGQLVLQPPAGQGASSATHARRVGGEVTGIRRYSPAFHANGHGGGRQINRDQDAAAGWCGADTPADQGVSATVADAVRLPSTNRNPKDSLIQATAHFSGDGVAQSRPPFTVTFQTYQNPL